MSPLQYSILTHIHTRGCLFVCFLVRPTGLETHRQIIFFNIAPNLTGGVAVNPEGACSFVPFVARPRFLAPPPLSDTPRPHNPGLFHYVFDIPTRVLCSRTWLCSRSFVWAFYPSSLSTSSLFWSWFCLLLGSLLIFLLLTENVLFSFFRALQTDVFHQCFYGPFRYFLFPLATPFLPFPRPPEG